jgi:NifU-like protein involved in Fe-S cluster formation
VTESAPAGPYSARFLEHLLRPRLQGSLEAPTHRGTAEDPVCGDRLTLDLHVDRGVVRDARFRVLGCPGSIAVGSAMATLLVGRPAAAGAVPAADLETEVGGVPAAKRHALRLAADALAAALAAPSPAAGRAAGAPPRPAIGGDGAGG